MRLSLAQRTHSMCGVATMVVLYPSQDSRTAIKLTESKTLEERVALAHAECLLWSAHSQFLSSTTKECVAFRLPQGTLLR